MTTNHDDINGSNLRKQASGASIEVSLLAEQLAAAIELIRSNGWGDEEGYQIIFLNGLHFLLGEKGLQALDCDHDSLSGEVERLTRELMEYQSMYAAMKYKAFTLSEEKYVLEGNVSGFEASDRFATRTIKRFRQENETLKSRIRQLEEEIAMLRQDLGGEETVIRLPRDGERTNKRSWWPWKR